MLKAVIFDFNGALLSSEPLSERFEKTYEVPRATFMKALKEVLAVVRKPDAPYAFTLWKPYLDKWHVKLSSDEFFDFWFSGEVVAKDTLAYIKELEAQDLEIFIFSNSFRERTMYFRSKFPELFAHVTDSFFSWETGCIKPSKKGLELLLHEHSLKPDQVIYFDDTKENIAVAKKLGIEAHLWSGVPAAKKLVAAKAKA